MFRDSFNALFSEVLDSDGSVKLVGRSKCRELLAVCEQLDVLANFGDAATGLLDVDNILRLREALDVLTDDELNRDMGVIISKHTFIPVTSKVVNHLLGFTEKLPLHLSSVGGYEGLSVKSGVYVLNRKSYIGVVGVDESVYKCLVLGYLTMGKYLMPDVYRHYKGSERLYLYSYLNGTEQAEVVKGLEVILENTQATEFVGFSGVWNEGIYKALKGKLDIGVCLLAKHNYNVLYGSRVS